MAVHNTALLRMRKGIGHWGYRDSRITRSSGLYVALSCETRGLDHLGDAKQRATKSWFDYIKGASGSDLITSYW